MPARHEIMQLEQQSERLGLLWRSQGQKFLDDQAEELMADVDRLRESYVAAMRKASRSPARPAKVIDLREDIVSGMACTRDGHGFTHAVGRCTRCGNVFCGDCLVHTDRKVLCTECALVVSGVNHNRLRPLTAPGRPADRG